MGVKTKPSPAKLKLGLSLAIMLSQTNLAEVGVGAELGNKRWSH